MRLKKSLERYIYDKEYKIIVKNNYVNIVNYDEIIDFNLNSISVKHQNKTISIEGKNLIITKMVNDEVLITGEIDNIRIS